jgi:UTP--glucose-1-phosphate uridylyltransferase
VYGATFEGGRYDTGTVPAYLETIVELALERPDLGPEFGAFLGELCRRKGLV